MLPRRHEGVILGIIHFSEGQRPAIGARNIHTKLYILQCTIRWETFEVEHSNNKRRSTMNITYTVREPRTPAESDQTGIFKWFARACWDPDQRIYLAAITDPKTGRVDPAVERQVALTMLG